MKISHNIFKKISSGKEYETMHGARILTNSVQKFFTSYSQHLLRNQYMLAILIRLCVSGK